MLSVCYSILLHWWQPHNPSFSANVTVLFLLSNDRLKVKQCQITSRLCQPFLQNTQLIIAVWQTDRYENRHRSRCNNRQLLLAKAEIQPNSNNHSDKPLSTWKWNLTLPHSATNHKFTWGAIYSCRKKNSYWRWIIVRHNYS